MNGAQMTDSAALKQKDEIRRIEQSLDALLSAIDQHDAWCDRAGVRPKLRPIDAEDLIATEFSPVEELLNRPVPAALRGGIKELGRRLFDLGGTKLMGQVCDRVAEMGGSWDKRMTILDARWDGIGNQKDRWLG
jgi:hypothetical protein